MSFTAIEDTPILVNILDQAKTTGWTLDGNIATHESCNSGYLNLLTYPLIVPHIYQVSYSILSISGGSLQLFAGDTAGVSRTTPGLYVETITASGINPELKFFSDANCQVQQLNAKDTIVNTDPKQQNTICYSAINKKWSDFRTFSPDFGFSLFIHTYTVFQGNLWEHANNSGNRNNFYGVQFDSIIKFVENKNSQIVKTFEKISYQANTLLITTTDGITTPLGQVSELVPNDFLQYTLNDGVTSVDVYTADGLYCASFRRDKNTDIINGNSLKGNYIICELIQETQAVALILFTVGIQSAKSFNNIR